MLDQRNCAAEFIRDDEGGNSVVRHGELRALVVLSLWLVVSISLWGQQRQALNTGSNENPTYFQRVGAGYWPSTGAGLILNVRPGTTFCGNAQHLAGYAGGTFRLADNMTNYVYFDARASCVLAKNTTGFALGQIPLARVVTSSGAIRPITDARSGTVQALGTDSGGRFATKYLNGLRFADQFPGVTGTAKQDAAMTDIGASNVGLVVIPPGTGSGQATSYSNQIGVLDFRQTVDPISNFATDPDRTPLILLENFQGELTTKPLTGTVTLIKGSTAVTGVGTKFTTELSGHLGRSIRLRADASTGWARVASVIDDTHATLAGNYSGTGGTGAAVYFVTQLGFVVRNLATAGTPNTASGGESVGITVVSKRSGGSRSIWGQNINLAYDTPVLASDAQTEGMEIDVSNNSSLDDVPGFGFSSGLHILSAGSKKPMYGLSVLSSTGLANTNSFQRGIWIGNYSQQGLYIDGGTNHIYLVPYADNSKPMLVGRNSADSATRWRINNDGSARFDGPVGLATDNPNPTSRLHAYVAADAFKIPVRLENDNNGAGTVGLGLGVASSGSESSNVKAGFALTRNLSNGRGDACLFNRLANDAADFTPSDWFICNRGGGYMGRTEIRAQGADQDVVLTPSGAGHVTTSRQIQTKIATGTPPFSVASTTPVANLTTVPLTYSSTGVQQTGVHLVSGNCRIGTDCAVTLAGEAAFTDSTTYRCTASDNTAANPVVVNQSSGSKFVITGNPSDMVSYICVGN
ncbi:MAG: hypothetical protein HY508_06095 [Acidobacteria bacterium]|nr:hypothetical protein [Acidobacteriota bacterium]